MNCLVLDGLMFCFSRLHIVSAGGSSDSIIKFLHFTGVERLARFSDFVSCVGSGSVDHMVGSPFPNWYKGNLNLPVRSFFYDWKLRSLMAWSFYCQDW